MSMLTLNFLQSCVDEKIVLTTRSSRCSRGRAAPHDGVDGLLDDGPVALAADSLLDGWLN